MSRYVTKEISLDELYLDEKNPRFIIPPNPTQQSIVDYLIENEEVEQLAMDIAKSKGLYAGDRVIVTQEGGRWIVLEGNRRVCACKILLNPSLLANRRLASVDKISLLVTESLKRNIEIVNVDVMKNRLEAQSSLAARHIDGIKKWSTISKYKFFVLEFDAGKSIEEIALITGLSVSKIKTGLKEYRIIDYVLNLPFWTQEEKENYLNLQEIKTSRLTRLFSTKAEMGDERRFRDIIGLDYDEKYAITTSLDRNIFDKIMYIVAQAAFVPNFAKDFNGTRSTYADIPQLMQYLGQNNLIDIEKQEQVHVVPDETQKKDKECQGSSGNKKNSNTNSEERDGRQYTSNRSVLIPEDFNVKCTAIKINDIVNELKRLNFNYCINAQAVLLRVLLELSMKYYLSKVNEASKIVENNIVGTYTAVLESMRIKNLLSVAEHSNLTQLKKNDKMFSIFNGYVHYDSVVPNREGLIYYFDNLRKFIEICLNS